jgi:hypothetical protein
MLLKFWPKNKMKMSRGVREWFTPRAAIFNPKKRELTANILFLIVVFAILMWIRAKIYNPVIYKICNYHLHVMRAEK